MSTKHGDTTRSIEIQNRLSLNVPEWNLWMVQIGLDPERTQISYVWNDVNSMVFWVTEKFALFPWFFTTYNCQSDEEEVIKKRK